jgi:hypothetical protein
MASSRVIARTAPLEAVSTYQLSLFPVFSVYSATRKGQRGESSRLNNNIQAI